jgi:hypothetical protein
MFFCPQNFEKIRRKVFAKEAYGLPPTLKLL